MEFLRSFLRSHFLGKPVVTECRLFCQPKCDQWSVVLKVDSAMHWINHYPLDCAIGFPNTYPIDSDLSDG